MQQPVGVIGLGLIGSALVERLRSAGFSMMGFDIDAAQAQTVTGARFQSSASAPDVFAACQTVLLSLPTSTIVRQVLAESLDQLRDGHTVIDLTTGDPAHAERTAAELSERHVGFLEAPIAGSSAQVRAGMAVLLLGGNESLIRELGDLLEALSPERVYLGAVGAASRFKLVHNLVLGLHRAVLAEGLQCAEALGLDQGDVLQTLMRTPAASRVMDTKGAKMVARDYQPQATLSQHLKDVRLILAAAAQSNFEAPLSEVHARLLERAEQLGFGDADNSAVIEAYSRTKH